MPLTVLLLIAVLALIPCAAQPRRSGSGRSRQRVARIRIHPSTRAAPIDETADEDMQETINAFAEYGIALTQRANFAMKESDRARRNADILRVELDSEALTYKKRQALEKQLAAAERAEVKNNADAMRLYAQAQIQYAKARKMEEKARNSAPI